MKKLKKALITVLSIVYFLNSNAQLNYKLGNNNKDLDSTITELLSHIIQDSVESFMRGLESFDTRYANADNHRDVAMWLVYKFQEFGFEEVFIDSFPRGSVSDPKWQYNISVIIPGSINPDQVYIIGGHWDSVSGDAYNQAPGADDNASGSTAVLEVARVMKLLDYQPKSTIRFILFDTEELGLIGSRIDALIANETGMDIKLMLNNDMIANADSGYTKFRIHKYDNAGWAAYVSQIVAENYTYLLPKMAHGASNSDSYAYYEQNYPAIYFEEFVQSPHYHQTTDLTDYLNMDYCTEIIKLNCALLTIYTTAPFLVTEFYIKQTGDGTSLKLSWNMIYNSDISGYNIYVENMNDETEYIIFTSDTSYIVSGLTEGATYNLGISALDSDSMEGIIVYKEKTPFSAPFDLGIAIIDESSGGIMNPTDEEIDDFYELLVQNYEHTKFDILNKEEINLSLLRNYSSVIWHINRLNFSNTISTVSETLTDYLDLGGNILITSDRFSFAVQGDGVYNHMDIFNKGEFIKDYLKIDSALIRTLSLFNGAYSDIPDFHFLSIDTSKVLAEGNYHIQLKAQALFPGENAIPIYFYNSDYDDSTYQGYMNGMPVGVLVSNETYNTISLGFPLYYMNLYQSKIFIDQVLQNVFGETTNATMEIIYPDHDIVIWPNPASDIINISFNKFETTIKHLNIYNIYGNLIQQVGNPENIEYQRSISIQNLEAGMYFLSIETSNNYYSIKIIKH